MAEKHESETEYLIPAPVLTSNDKLFNFGVVAFSVMEMIELVGVFGIVFLLWKILFFLPTGLMIMLSIILVALSFFFITQPINGLPGDTWIRYAFRFYVVERNKHIIHRRGRNYITIKSMRIVGKDGKVLVQLGSAKIK